MKLDSSGEEWSVLGSSLSLSFQERDNSPAEDGKKQTNNENPPFHFYLGRSSHSSVTAEQHSRGRAEERGCTPGKTSSVTGGPVAKSKCGVPRP